MIRIEKEKFKDFILDLMERYSVYAFVAGEKKTSFGKIGSPSEIEQDLFNTEKSPKEVFFPHAEVLFEYDSGEIKKSEEKEKPIAVWGIRGCDAKSYRLLDMVFGSARQQPENIMFQDPYWKDKYDSALIFVLACNDPRSTCFCNWFGGGPHERQGSDVFAVDIGDAYLLEPVSEKGKAYIETIGNKDSATADDLRKAEELGRKANDSIREPSDMKGISAKMKELFHTPIWIEIGSKCVNCGACAYICPTCHCFDVQDEGKGKKGKRIRIWDSCMFPIFTMEASGHNPRGMSNERLRQRFMHKLSYFMDNYGEHLCTGCGRCVLVCPVNLDIREVVKKVMAC